MPDFTRLARDRVLTLGLTARREADLIEELAGQMEEIYTASLAEGISETEAFGRALASLPAAGSFRQHNWTSGFRQAWRQQTRQPWFLAAAVLAIATGIGATVTIFSLLDAVVLRPLDYERPHELVMVWERYRGGPDNVVAAENYLRWRGRTHAFLKSSPVISMTRNLVGVGEPIEVGIEAVAWDYLRMLGNVDLTLGRDFLPEDDEGDTPAAVLLSQRLWRDRFDAAGDVVGRRLQLDGVEAVVVGVLPAGFRSLGEDPEMLTTARLDAAADYRIRGRFLRVVARVGDIGFAQRELSRVARMLENERPDFNAGWSVRVAPLKEHFSSSARRPLTMLMAAVAVVLLIVCGNLANLLLARLAARERELAIRFAVGAQPQQLAWQLLQESLLLALLGGLAGCAFAYAAIHALRNIADVPRLADAALDWRVLSFAVLITLASAVLFGLAPAIQASRTALARTPRPSRASEAFVIAQVALALVLLLGAVSLVQKFRETFATHPGFDPRNVLTLSIARPGPRDADGFFSKLEQSLHALPEVEHVGAVAWLPLAGPGPATEVNNGAFKAAADVRVATATYFAAMRIPVLEGAPSGLAISESLARALFPDGKALGRTIQVNLRDHDQPQTVAAVVGDVRHQSLEAPAHPTVYFPHATFPHPAMTIVMRAKSTTSQSTTSLASAARARVRELDPQQPVRALRSMEEWIGQSLAEKQALASAVGAFAATALVLALMAVYGTFSRLVCQRLREIGIRLALGAEPADVLAILAKHGLALLAAGLALGLLLWNWPARVWGLAPSAAVVSMTIFAFISLSAGAVLGPARQAIRTDPLAVLRQE